MIDVVIPVYRGFDQTRRCIDSVLACTPASAAEIVVIDDATPEPAIAAWLDELAAQRGITLLRNEANRGFVQSVNRGMALHAERDVVLLNSDTEVANDWLARLAAAARRDTRIATVTPFSNNATLCSYPFWGWTGAVPGGLGLAALDAAIARANAGRTVDIPTGVGFCIYIRRDALDAFGLFDADRFGRGYGEENDFCMRALKTGRRNVLAGDVFVYHEGSVSFSTETAERTVAATRALLEVHPDYPDRVEAFLLADPAGELRMAADLARIQADSREASHVLHERAAEVARWSSQARGVEQNARRREAELDAALKTMTDAVARQSEALEAHERASQDALAEIRRLNEEIGDLRRGLANAEELAFARERELAEIRKLPLFRYYDYVMRRSKGTA